jgi:hypothetical protein
MIEFQSNNLLRLSSRRSILNVMTVRRNSLLILGRLWFRSDKKFQIKRPF